MVKKKRQQKVDPAANRPFAALERLVRESGLSLENTSPLPTDSIVPSRKESDEEAFERAMTGVKRSSWRHMLARTPPSPAVVSADPRLEDLRLMQDAAKGNPAMSIPDHPEYIEGWIGVSGKHFLPKLRAGLYSIQAIIDLHGLSKEMARMEVEKFIIRNARYRACCIKVIHGRGINSPDAQPVLKQQLQDWLSNRKMSRYVVAFASAQPADGGVGALYVLVRRRLIPS